MLPFAFLKTIHFHFYFIKKLKYYLSVMLRKRKTMQKHFPYFIFTYSYTGVYVNLWKTKYMLTASCCIWINYKTSGTMSFGKTRAKWRRLAPPNSISAQTPHSNCQTQWWRSDSLCFLHSHRTMAPCSYRVDHELKVSKHSRIKHEGIFPTAKAWPKLDNATGRWSQTHQQIGKRRESRCGPLKVKISTAEILWQNLKRAVLIM